ncbi:hypothetical protein DFH09DRAFT_1380190 [Mycena vulgaris]|nr:hypothetical protein DFH09DRAFT_1380190 [Mycena vulgaris]
MLPIKPTLIAAFTFAFAVHAQVCIQCPATDNIGQGLAGNTPLIPGAGLCCVLFFPQWEKFTVLARERLKLLEEFDSPSHVSVKISDKHDFQRCSSCREFYYFSRDCQILDWRAGHREACSSFGAFRMLEILSASDLSFLRAVVQSDYLGARFDIFIAKIGYFRNPENPPVFTAFDYSVGHATVNVTPIPYHPGHVDAEWDHFTARVFASRGRMALHRLQVHEGGSARVWMFRLRYSHSGVHDTLAALAAALPPPL